MAPLTFTNLKGGRNGIDSPLELAENQCAEAFNVDWSDGPLGRKRGGMHSISTDGGTAFTTVVAMFRHIPDGNDQNAEFWAIDNATVPVVKRLTPASYPSWEDITLDDPITDKPQDVAFLTLNGKLFLGYDSNVNRLHVFDPEVTRVRRVGLAAPSPPTVANEGSGAYAAVLRYYRIRVVQLDTATGIKVIRRSEPSDPVSITPSGSGASIRITQGTLPNEHETHWEIEISSDGLTWFILVGTSSANAVSDALPIATLTYDDTITAAAFADLDAAEEIGLFTLPTSAKLLATDGNRLIMGNSYDLTDNSSRIWFTPVLGAADHGDDERIINTDTIKGWVDLNEKDGGSLTALFPPLQGMIYATKYRQVWKLLPTSDATAPYIPRKVTDAIGCTNFKTVVAAEDAKGNQAIGFLTHKGPYRVDISGLVHIGRDVEDVWYGLNTRESEGLVRLDAQDGGVTPMHGLYHTDLHQIWWYLVIDTDFTPRTKIVFDVRQAITQDQYGLRGGWSVHEGKSAQAYCSVMFSETLGTKMSRRLKPYIGYNDPAT